MTIAAKEIKESWKTPAVMGSIAIIILVFFGIFGKKETVAFQISGDREAIQLPNLDIESSLLGTISGIVFLVRFH